MRLAALVLMFAISLFMPVSANAQDDNAYGLAKSVAKDVVSDPTTYVPFGIALAGTKLDWDSSQIFFEHGFIESNPQFTISGLPNDIPLSHADGNRRVITTSLPALYQSAGNNLTIGIGERLLIRKYPEYRKLIKTIGWIERIAVNGYVAYFQSVNNWKQWQKNKDTARQLGW